jgi:hypothetical protein
MLARVPEPRLGRSHRSERVAVALTRTTANTPALALYHSVGFRKTKTFVSPEGITLCSLEWVRREAPEVGP